VGLLLACIIILSPSQDSPGEGITNSHGVLYLLPLALRHVLFGETGGTALMRYGWPAVIIIFYGGLGMLIGKIQQMANDHWRWLLTALLALLLLVFYVMNYYA
jgi:hypothetical protein